MHECILRKNDQQGDVKAWLNGSVWLPPVTQGSSLKQKLSSSTTPAAFLAFIHVAIWNSTDKMVLLKSRLEPYCRSNDRATEDSREQRRLGAPGALFCEAEKTGCAMKAALG